MPTDTQADLSTVLLFSALCQRLSRPSPCRRGAIAGEDELVAGTADDDERDREQHVDGWRARLKYAASTMPANRQARMPSEAESADEAPSVAKKASCTADTPRLSATSNHSSACQPVVR